jgi:hypothetical protein
MALMTARSYRRPGNLSACGREFQSPRAWPGRALAGPDPQGCSVREHMEGGHEPMIISFHSLSCIQPPR